MRGGFRKQLFIGNDHAPESGALCMGSHFERQVLPRKIPRPDGTVRLVRVLPWFYLTSEGEMRHGAYPLRAELGSPILADKGWWNCHCHGMKIAEFYEELELGGPEARASAKLYFQPHYKADPAVKSLSHTQHMLLLMHVLARDFAYLGTYETLRNAVVCANSFFDISAAEVVEFGPVLFPTLVEDGWLTREQAEAMHVYMLLG